MAMKDNLLPGIWFGKFGEPRGIDWRTLPDEPDPDDEELEQTPQDVIDLLGFDPKEFSSENKKKTIKGEDVGHPFRGNQYVGGQSGDKWAAGLSSSEKRTLKSWTEGDQFIIRNFQMDGEKYDPKDPADREAKRMLDAMNSALERAPKVKGLLYRGLEMSPGFNPMSEFKAGTTYKLNAHSSATPDITTAACFASRGRNRVILSIKTKTAADITRASTREFRWQNEHILRSGTSYKVERIETGRNVSAQWGPDDDEPSKIKNMTIIHLREL